MQKDQRQEISVSNNNANLTEMSENRGNFIKSLEKKIESAISKSAENPALGWVLSNIPIYGPAIQSAMTTLETAILTKRMSDFVISVHEEALLIDQSKVDQSYFETEEFYDFVRRALENTARTRDQTKIKLYARILVRAPILDNAIFRSSIEDFFAILLELSPADLHLAREVFEQQKDLPEEFNSIEQDELRHVKDSGWDDLPNTLRINKSQFGLSVTKLVRIGLLRQVIGTYQSYIGDAYSITPVFRTLMTLIEKL